MSNSEPGDNFALAVGLVSPPLSSARRLGPSSPLPPSTRSG